MSNKTISIIVVLALIAVGIFLFMGRSVAPTDLENGGNNLPAENEGQTEEEASTIKEFTVDASNFTFSPSVITVNEGDRVRITLNNTQGFHDFKIDELNVVIPVVQVGQSQVIEFVADRKGTFEYYCSVGTHRAQGMVGSFIVE